MNLAKARFFLCSQVSVEQMTEGHRSERVVGERKLALREPYGARRTRLREYPIDSRSQNEPRESEVFFVLPSICGTDDRRSSFGAGSW